MDDATRLGTVPSMVHTAVWTWKQKNFGHKNSSGKIMTTASCCTKSEKIHLGVSDWVLFVSKLLQFINNLLTTMTYLYI